ncbi:MAG TPA: GNAT family N-acetyltransferase [Steroidobacteraceae bacterium]|nr:GNAT family N-acetyltransferase [Steroidobacteraceae bacterium]
MNEVKFSVEMLRPGLIPAWMINDHFQENAKHRNVFERVDPDWDYYAEIQRKGELVMVIARDEKTLELVGYIALVLRPHPHYRTVKVAVDDLHYLLPSRRGLGAGKRMLQYAESAAREAGAQVFSMRHKAAQDHGHIFRALGYELTDMVYTKDIRNAEPPLG